MVGDRNVSVTLALIPYLKEFVSNPPGRTRCRSDTQKQFYPLELLFQILNISYLQIINNNKALLFGFICLLWGGGIEGACVVFSFNQ